MSKMGSYFIIGMFSTLSFNAVLSQMADNLLAGVLSIIGGETTMGEVIAKR